MLYVKPPVAKPTPPVGVVAVNASVELLQLKVRFVVVVNSQTFALLPESVQVPLPMFSVRVPVPDPLNPMLFGLVSVTLLLLAEKSKVPVNAPIVMDRTLIVVLTVTVPPPLDASNVTVSLAPGTLCPPAPLDVAAQCVVSEASQVPVPPTQNLLAM